MTRTIRQQAKNSLELASAILALTLLVAVPLGILVASLTREGRRRRLDIAFTGAMSAMGAIPEYLLATVLALLFAVLWRLFPVAGGGGLKTLVLPTLAVSMPAIGVLSRIVRVETLGVLAQDYIRTARGKRLPSHTILIRHVLPNVLTSVLTVGGIIFAGMIGGAVIVENVFARPGLGTALVSAILSYDYPMVEGITLTLGIAVVVINFGVDVTIGLIDRRSLIRQS